MPDVKQSVGRVVTGIDKAVEWTIALVFGIMVIVGGLQVFLRYILQNSLSWSEEAQKYMHIWLIFLALPLAYKRGAHIGMNILFDRLPKKMQWLMLVTVDLLWFCLGGVMVVYTNRIMHVAKRQTSPGLGIRMDLVYICIVIGGAYLCFMAARKLYGRLFNSKAY